MFSNSFQIGSLDPSGAAATWRASLSRNKKNLYTSASTAAEYRFQGNQPKIQNAYNYKKRVVTGIRGAAFDQQTDDKYWQTKQIQPTINRPLGSGIRQAMLINEGVYNINPIAGTNAFGGGVVSRASGLNPTNYSISNTDDIEDRLRAHAVPANDPLSAEFAKGLPQGQQLDPGNVEGDAMINTFANDNSIARNAKTQVWDSNLFPSGQDAEVDEGVANPFGNANNTSLEYVRKASLGRINDEVNNKTVSAILANYRNSYRRNNAARAQDMGWVNQAINPAGGLGVGGDQNVVGRRGPRGGGGGGGDGGGGGGGAGSKRSMTSAFDQTTFKSNTQHISTRGVDESVMGVSENLALNIDPSYNWNTSPLINENNGDDDDHPVTTAGQIFSSVTGMVVGGIMGGFNYLRGYHQNNNNNNYDGSFSSPEKSTSSYDLESGGSSSSSENASFYSVDQSFASSSSGGGSPRGPMFSPGYKKKEDQSFDLLPEDFKEAIRRPQDDFEENMTREFIDLHDQGYGSREAYSIIINRYDETLKSPDRLKESIAQANERSEAAINVMPLIQGQISGLITNVAQIDVYGGHELVKPGMKALLKAASTPNAPIGSIVTNGNQTLLQSQGRRNNSSNSHLLAAHAPVKPLTAVNILNSNVRNVVESFSSPQARKVINKLSMIREAEGIEDDSPEKPSVTSIIADLEESLNRQRQKNASLNAKIEGFRDEKTGGGKSNEQKMAEVDAFLASIKSKAPNESTVTSNLKPSNAKLTESVGKGLSMSQLNTGGGSGQPLASAAATPLYFDPNSMARKSEPYSSSTTSISQPSNNLLAHQNTNYTKISGANNAAVNKIISSIQKVRNEGVNNGVQITGGGGRMTPSPMDAFDEMNERTIIDLTAQLSQSLYRINAEIPTAMGQLMSSRQIPVATAVDMVNDARAQEILTVLYPLVHAIAFSPDPQQKFTEVQAIILAVESANSDGAMKLSLNVSPSNLTITKNGRTSALPIVELALADTSQIGNDTVSAIARSTGLPGMGGGKPRRFYTYEEQSLSSSMMKGVKGGNYAIPRMEIYDSVGRIN